MSVHQTTEVWRGYHEKISARHLERLAVVYVRQSTMQQVLDHQASTSCNMVWYIALWPWAGPRNGSW